MLESMESRREVLRTSRNLNVIGQKPGLSFAPGPGRNVTCPLIDPIIICRVFSKRSWMPPRPCDLALSDGRTCPNGASFIHEAA